MEERTIDISTDNGLVARFNREDRRIATLTSLYDDPMTGSSNVPDVILLSGEAGKIADEEGELFLRTARTSNILHKEPITDMMMKLLEPESELPRWDHNLTYELVPYQKVERISRIFDWQGSDYLGVYVNAETPKHLRDYYYDKIGHYILRVGKRDPSVLFKVGRDSVLSRLFGFMRSRYDENSKLFIVAFGVVYNVLNISASTYYYSANGPRIKEEAIVWSDLVEVMQESSTEDTITVDDRGTIELFRYLAGDDVPSSALYSILNLASMGLFYTRSIPLLISAGLKRIDEDVSPDLIGLAGVMGNQPTSLSLPPDSERERALVMKVIATSIREVYSDQYLGLGQLANAIQLRNKLGNYNVQRILISILLYLEQGKKARGYAKLGALARGLEKL